MLDFADFQASEGNFTLFLHGASMLVVRVYSSVNGWKSLFRRSPWDVELRALGRDDRDGFFESSGFGALKSHADDGSDFRFAHKLSKGLRSHRDGAERYTTEGTEHWDVLKCAGGRQISRANDQLYLVLFQSSSDCIQAKDKFFAELSLVLLLLSFRVGNLRSLRQVF